MKTIHEIARPNISKVAHGLLPGKMRQKRKTRKHFRHWPLLKFARNVMLHVIRAQNLAAECIVRSSRPRQNLVCRPHAILGSTPLPHQRLHPSTRGRAVLPNVSADRPQQLLSLPLLFHVRPYLAKLALILVQQFPVPPQEMTGTRSLPRGHALGHSRHCLVCLGQLHGGHQA